MPVPALLFLAAVTIRPDTAELRSGCSATESLVATLPAGTPVEVRFAISDGSDCYKIAASYNGQTVIGYVPGEALAGLGGFERERASAAETTGVPAPNPIESLGKLESRNNDPQIARAIQLIRSNQPQQALEILEPVARRHGNSPEVLMLVGVAAYRSDQLRAALDYWKQSLDLRPNDALQQLYARVQRESAEDKSADKLYGNRVLLRYEGATIPADAARNMVALVDAEFTRISGQLGCPAEERLVVIVQSREAYFKSTGAAEWSAGSFDGRVRIALENAPQKTGLPPRRELAHEIVHACLTNIASGGSPWPAWLQEGMAQKLSGDTLSKDVRVELQRMAAAHELPKLEALAQNWSRLDPSKARLAYALALAAVDQLFESYANYGIRNVLNNPDRLPQITADIDRKLGL